MGNNPGDGWHDLPGGGAVEIKESIPVRVSDKGNWTLEETAILAAAARHSGMKLTWATDDRSTRWRRDSILSVLRGGNVWSWCYARVLRVACELCGQEPGTQLRKIVGQDELAWVGEECAKDDPEVER